MNYTKEIIKYFSVSHVDGRGQLTVITDNIPTNNFEIKRVYYIKTEKKDTIRGGHAHHKITQILFSISGKLKVEYNNGKTTGCVLLNEDEGMVITPLIWVNIRSLTDNSLYLVLANGEYDEDEYIRDEKRFMELTSK